MKKLKKCLLQIFFVGLFAFAFQMNVSAQVDEAPDGYKEIHDIADLMGIRNDPSGNYILMNDIDMTEETKKGGSWDSGMGWTPIETFSGNLDGNGYRIKGMTIYGEAVENVGLFGKLDGATIMNLGVIDVNIDVERDNNSLNAGAIAGTMENGAAIVESYSSGDIKTKEYRHSTHGNGGIAGSMNYGNIIINSFSTTNVSADYYAGGIVGEAISYSSQLNYIVNCYSGGKMQVANEFPYGATGGIVAKDNRSDIRNCFYRKDKVDQTSTISGVKPLTDAAMKHAQSFTGFDFEDTWEIDEYSNYNYPQIKDNRYIKVENLKLISPPKKTTYLQGEKLDLTGASVKIVYEDENEANIVVTKDMLESYDMSKIGTHRITVNRGNRKVHFDIEVVGRPVQSITLSNQSLQLNKGKSAQLKATPLPANASDKTITWESGDKSIATVDENGKVTARGAGTTTITVRATSGVTAKCKVTVKVPAVKILLDEPQVYLRVKGVEQLGCTVSPIDSTDRVHWSSSDTKVVKVESNNTEAKVTAVGEGYAVITAKADSGVYKKCEVWVDPLPKPQKIVVSKSSIKKVTAYKGRKVQVKCSASSKASGYQIQYSMKRNFSGAKTKTVKSTTNYITSLKANKRYYFRVRAYRKVNGKTYYSGWSGSKNIKVRK